MKIADEIFKEYQNYYKWSISDYLMKFCFLWFAAGFAIPLLYVVMSISGHYLTSSLAILSDDFCKILDKEGTGNMFIIWWISNYILGFAWCIAEGSLAEEFLKKNPAYKKLVSANALSNYIHQIIFR